MKKAKSVQKLITFPKGLYEQIMSKAEYTGVGFSDYIRHISIRYLEEELPVEYLNERQETSLGDAMKDIAEGRFTEHDSVDDLIEDLHKLKDAKK